MEIHDRQKLIEFCEKHAKAKASIDNWLTVTEIAEWRQPLDIISSFSKASYVPAKKVAIFRLGGKRNDRLIAKVDFSGQAVRVVQVLTRQDKGYADWDKLLNSEGKEKKHGNGKTKSPTKNKAPRKPARERKK